MHAGAPRRVGSAPWRKKSRKNQSAPVEGEVGPRQPCPCGSGKRYKACHGAAGGAATPFVARPFEGLAGECDLIALRELVPAATAPLTLAEGVPGAGSRVVRLNTLLPVAAPAMVRDSGEVWLGLQVQHNYGDPARDLGAVLLAALEQAERGESGIVGLTSDPGEGPRLQDLVANTELDVTVHDTFEFWVSDVADAGEDFAAALSQANDTIRPTARLEGVEAAYWTNVGTKEHLRWVMPHDEDALLTALARLHAAGKDVLVEGARFVGMFRAHGLLTPVWDLPVGTGAAALEEPAKKFAADLKTALADDSDLTQEERSARAGLANRQVTIR
ncbi:topoisomerase II [Nocardioides jishulii]|nr:topoisomerase II [Nocardioides jishulii]